jgi:hypothetical protein
MVATAFGLAGLGLSFGVGLYLLRMETWEVIFSIIGSNLSALISLFLVIGLEKKPWFKRKVFTSSLNTWIFFATSYFGFLLLFAPALLDWERLWKMALPLIFSNGFALLVFGVLQDRRVQKNQRKQRGMMI